MNTRWAEQYMGIPFVDDGLDRRGLNCWGLVRLVLAEQVGLELPRYTQLSPKEMIKRAREITRDFKDGSWFEVESEKPFDLVVMKSVLGGREVAEGHIGVVTQPGWMLHVEQGIESAHVAFRESPTIARRVTRIIRHRDLA